MPWQEVSTMSLRQEFVQLAQQPDANVSQLCRRFGISRKTAYKWLARFADDGPAGLADHSRRPHATPYRTAATIEARILTLRDQHPCWGPRKLAARLAALGVPDIPAPSTIGAILRRHGRIAAGEAAKHTAWQTFERAAPNDVWQLDFLGHLPVGSGRVHPLCILDDHSRYALGLFACPDEQGTTVQAHLITCFRRYGLPWAILSDNGPPWGVTHPGGALTWLGAWLLRLDIAVWHGRPGHPQTQGKVERFHRTVAAEVLTPYAYPDLPRCQAALDGWRTVYNHERPHQALALAVPASRYRLSPRPYPEVLAPIAYGPDVFR